MHSLDEGSGREIAFEAIAIHRRVKKSQVNEPLLDKPLERLNFIEHRRSKVLS
jgi:hypothetical protein